MPFKLSKSEDMRRGQLQAKLEHARECLFLKLEDVNDAVQTAVDALESAVTDYNCALEDARSFVADIVSQAEEDFSDKSERWQEGERGECARAWIDEWEQADLENVDMPDFEPLAIEAEDHAGALEQLPSETE